MQITPDMDSCTQFRGVLEIVVVIDAPTDRLVLNANGTPGAAACVMICLFDRL